MRLFPWLIVCLLLGGCWSSTSTPPSNITTWPEIPGATGSATTPATQGQSSTPAEDANVSDAKSRVAKLEGELRQAKVELKDRITERDAARLAGIRTLMNWVTGVLGIVAVGLTIAAFFSPVGKKTLGSGAVACVAGAAVAQTFGVSLPWLPWIGLGILVLAGGGALWAWRKGWFVGQEGIRTGTEALAHLRDVAEDRFKFVTSAASQRQMARGLKNEVDRQVSRFKPKKKAA